MTPDPAQSPDRLQYAPILGATAIGLIVALTPVREPLAVMAKVLFGLGLLLNYASIGALVALLRPLRPHWLFGLLVGVAYSLPGALLTAVPVPLRDDAPRYFRNFTAGGFREAGMTLLFGTVTGLVAGLLLRRR